MLHRVLCLKAVPKKREKEVYTSPKKIRPNRKKAELAVLKYYKVDSDGESERLRRSVLHMKDVYV